MNPRLNKLREIIRVALAVEAQGNAPFKVVELAEELGISHRTLRRYLHDFRSLGLVTEIPNGADQLGVRVVGRWRLLDAIKAMK